MGSEYIHKPSIHIPELPVTGVFRPYDYYRKNMLFASQGHGTVLDEGIQRSFIFADSPISLVVLVDKLIIFEGHHRTSWAILQKIEIPFCLKPAEEANLVHIYPFYTFFREYKQRVKGFDY